MLDTPLSLTARKLVEQATLPTKGHPSDLGWDLYASADCVVDPGQLVKISTGIAVEFPALVGGLIKDRSSLAAKGLHTIAGVIDPDYRGEIMVLAVNLGQESLSISMGDRFAQMILVQTLQADIRETGELNQTERGTGGFGSTGA